MSNNSGGSDCVVDKVREIVAAQDEVADITNGDCCTTGCEESIEQLLSPVANETGPGFTTIPIILYCKGDCDPFIASGVYQAQVGQSNNTYFGCVESPIFRAKKFVNDGESCVVLELLVPVTEGGGGAITRGDTVCDFFPGESRRDFQATGICITVDLNCFCGIACLDPVTPLPSVGFPA